MAWPKKPVIDLAGKRFGKLRVIARAGSDPIRQATWACRCDCGNLTVTNGADLRRGHTKTCGCGQRDGPRARMFKHGATIGDRCSPEYMSWRAMILRCSDPKADSYRYYGGRGITICTRWREGFVAFFADMGQRPNGHTLDRINNDGNYEPGNCRWATFSQQRHNQRTKRD